MNNYKMNNYKIYIVYHKENQIQDYNLHEDENHILYDVRQNIGKNYLNPVWSEMVAMYNIWKNGKTSDYIGFNHYRRQFTVNRLPNANECQIYTVFNFGTPIINQYALCHRRQDIESIINILNKKYGQNNPYSDHLLHSTHMIGNCCFLMTWENFDRMMKFMFDILEEFSIQESCYEDLDRWVSWAISNFGEENYRYQMRVIGFLAERLISAYISVSWKIYL